MGMTHDVAVPRRGRHRFIACIIEVAHESVHDLHEGCRSEGLAYRRSSKSIVGHGSLLRFWLTVVREPEPTGDNIRSDLSHRLIAGESVGAKS